MISKRKIINSLFVVSFPWYGVGAYNVMKQGFAIGIFLCAIPYLLIIFFFLLDRLYRSAPRVRVNRRFYWVLGALVSLSASVIVGLSNHSPLLTTLNSWLLILLFNAPFFSALIVSAYNADQLEEKFMQLVLNGLVIFVAVNVMGIAAGLRNMLHYFPGRANPPFAFGLYDAAHVLAMVSLILLPFIGKFKARPMRTLLYIGIYCVCVGMILSINSRLSVMIFIVLTVLAITQALKALRGLFTVSLFTMPIMMSFALLIYQILSLPIFAAIVERVDKKDITTFNGRTYIWESAASWLVDDRRGLLFGNGYNGQYHLRLLNWVAKLWGESGSYRLHMHSAFLESLINQGIVGILLMYGVYWYGYRFFREQYQRSGPLGPLYLGFVYLMFAWQIDIIGYGFYTGFMLLMVLMAPVAFRAPKVRSSDR